MRACIWMRSTVGPLRYEINVCRTGSLTSAPDEPWPSCAFGSTRQIRDFVAAGACVSPALAAGAAAASARLVASDMYERAGRLGVMASSPRATHGQKMVWRASLIEGRLV